MYGYIEYITMLYIYSITIAYVIACISSIVIYCKSLELTAYNLNQDIKSMKKSFPKMYEELMKKGFKKNDVRNYYQSTTDFDYRILELFCGQGMHSRMSGGKQQTSLILDEIHKCCATKVLEVGCGKGHCSLFLADACKNKEFHGVDLIEAHTSEAESRAYNRDITNASFFHSDFNEFQQKGTYDLIFGCESLCHMDNPNDAHEFVTKTRRILSSKGRVVIIDGFTGRYFAECSKEQKEAMYLAESGFRITEMPSAEQWTRLFISNGFTVIRDIDLTHNVLPFWTMGWRVASGVMIFPLLVKLLCVSKKKKETLSSLFSVMFTAHALRSGTAEYGMLVFEKQETIC